jgi:prophage regulatory protein
MSPIPPNQASPHPGREVSTAQVEQKPRSKVRTPQQARGPLSEPDRIIRERKVRERVSLSHATIWRKVRSGDFPAPVKLGVQAVGWVEREIDGWIAERMASREADA